MSESRSLRERKRHRTREAIIETAMALFAERGFAAATVEEIAARAEVGRTTFFRYFPDKQEVLFADDAELMQALTDAIDRTARDRAPLGDDLASTLEVVRVGLRALTDGISRRARWLAIRERLLQEIPALAARDLLKEHRYLQAAVNVLQSHGATARTAVLACELGAACYRAARATAGDDLSSALESAFERLPELTEPNAR